MMKHPGPVFVFVVALLAATASGVVHASGLITGVQLSPDFKRLTIQTEGPVAEPKHFEIDNPRRLVIDFNPGDLGDVRRRVSLKHKPIREIRTGRLENGARVVVEFSNYEIPEYRIRRLGNCHIVFFGRFRQAPGAEARLEPQDQVTGPHSPRGGRAQADTIHSEGGSKLLVRSARAVGDLIVLEVAERANPTRTFRVDIGIDLEQRGFTTANIRRLKNERVARPTAPRSTDSARLKRAPVEADQASRLSRAARRILSMR